MGTLADRIRAAREEWVTVEGHDWLLRRPTRLQLGQLAGRPADTVFSCVVGWKIPESELVPGGAGRVPEFDAEAFREYASDRPELLTGLSEHVMRMIQAHRTAQEAVEKN